MIPREATTPVAESHNKELKKVRTAKISGGVKSCHDRGCQLGRDRGFYVTHDVGGHWPGGQGVTKCLVIGN